MAILLAAYYRLLIDPNPQVHMPAAGAWSRYETVLALNLIPRHDEPSAMAYGDAASLALARASRRTTSSTTSFWRRANS